MSRASCTRRCVQKRCDNHAVTFKTTFLRRAVMAPAFVLCGAVVIGCTSPPPQVNVRLTLPSRAASPAASPSRAASPAPAAGTASTPANFHVDPGFQLGGSSNEPTFECCLGHDWSSSAADPQTWSPGEQVRITWIETARPAAGDPEDTMFLSATMYGHWTTVADAQNSYSSDNQVAAAAVVRWDTESAGSASSLMTIPADAAPGYYELQFSAAAQEVGGCGTAACAPGFYDAAIILVR